MMLIVAADRSSSDDSAVCYIFLVSCTTSCFHIHNWANFGKIENYVLLNSPGGGTGGEVSLYDCLI